MKCLTCFVYHRKTVYDAACKYIGHSWFMPVCSSCLCTLSLGFHLHCRPWPHSCISFAFPRLSPSITCQTQYMSILRAACLQRQHCYCLRLNLMKLFALLLLAIAALALAASTQELDAIPPDAVEVDPGVAVGNAQSSKSWPFSWSTTEYCENGVLRATGTFTVKGFQHTFKFDGVTTVYVKVFNEALRMTYNFERFCKLYIGWLTFGLSNHVTRH
jgi:hypothetical protein